MKTIPTLFTIFCSACSLLSFGQQVYSVNYQSEADVKVFVVDYESECDLNASNARGNEGHWYFEDYASQADKKIYFVKYASDADLKIFFVDYRSQAGWRNKSKQHLMY